MSEVRDTLFLRRELHRARRRIEVLEARVPREGPSREVVQLEEELRILRALVSTSPAKLRDGVTRLLAEYKQLAMAHEALRLAGGDPDAVEASGLLLQNRVLQQQIRGLQRALELASEEFRERAPESRAFHPRNAPSDPEPGMDPGDPYLADHAE